MSHRRWQRRQFLARHRPLASQQHYISLLSDAQMIAHRPSVCPSLRSSHKPQASARSVHRAVAPVLIAFWPPTLETYTRRRNVSFFERHKHLIACPVSQHSTDMFSSVQFNLFNGSQWKSQWKASLKRWVLSRAGYWLLLMYGKRRITLYS